MSFNKGYELKKFEAHWGKLRIEYAAAGMTEDAIQKMYDYDRQQFNSERTFIERTQEFTAPAYENSEEEASPLMLRYQEAITTMDTYHETKSKFAWIGEIENERLLSALENLSEDDLKLLTFYACEGYTVTEISKVLGVSQPTISIKIKRITNFLKKFVFWGVLWHIKHSILWVLSYSAEPLFIPQNSFVFFCTSAAPSLHSTPV